MRRDDRVRVMHMIEPKLRGILQEDHVRDILHDHIYKSAGLPQLLFRLATLGYVYAPSLPVQSPSIFAVHRMDPE